MPPSSDHGDHMFTVVAILIMEIVVASDHGDHMFTVVAILTMETIMVHGGHVDHDAAWPPTMVAASWFCTTGGGRGSPAHLLSICLTQDGSETNKGGEVNNECEGDE